MNNRSHYHRVRRLAAIGILGAAWLYGGIVVGQQMGTSIYEQPIGGAAQPNLTPPVSQMNSNGLSPQPSFAATPMPPNPVGWGNPFWHTGPVRSTRLTQELLGAAASPTPNQPAQPGGLAQPAVPPISTPIVPRYDDQVRPAGFDAGATPPPATEPAPQTLRGVALLKQPIDQQTQHQLTPVVAWLEDALVQLAGVQDYSCTFKKREAIDGSLQEKHQSMYVKVRQRPFSVYMFFLNPDVYGQEAMYVEGRNNGNLIAHPPAGLKQRLVGTVTLAPTDPQAMEGNRYPITDFGIERLCLRYLDRCREEMKYGECEVRVFEATVEGRACSCVQLVHPVPRREFRYFMSRLFVDNELNVPIRCENYAWPQPGSPPQLVEEYTYSNLKLNQGFGDADFDPANPNYQFR